MNRRDVLIGGAVAATAAVGATYVGRRRMGSMTAYNASVAASRAALARSPELSDLVRFAALAASGHNAQPWKFRVGDRRIDILPDFTRRTPAVDPDDHHLFASLGCATENLSLAAGASGRQGEASFNHADDGSITFEFGSTRSSVSPLFDAIPHRQSTRGEFDARRVSAADLRILAGAAAVPGVDVVLITERPQLLQVRDLVVSGNSTQMADAAFLRELKTWLRFSPREAIATGDGLFSATSGNPTLPDWLGPLVFDLVFKVDSENDKYSRHIASSAGIAVFVGERDDKEHWARAGQACQRFSLQATALGLKHAYINQPVEVERLRPELASLVGLSGRRPDVVMRFGYGDALPFSARRPVADVLA